MLLVVVGLGAGQNPTTAAEPTKSVVGKVVYERDLDRPWRLGRYYVKRWKSGELAEAVVALTDRGLDDLAPAAEPAEIHVDQKDYLFAPELTAVRVGDRVTFLNSDGALHNVRSNHPRQRFNVSIAPHGRHDVVFTSATGVRRPHELGCVYHSAMRAWIYVFDHPWYAVTGADGEFAFLDLPPGEYRLEVAHPAGGLRARRSVVVTADEGAPIEIRLTPDDLINQP